MTNLMMRLFKNFESIRNKNIFLLFSILPIGLLAGSAIANTIIILINIFFIIEIYKKNKFSFLINKWFYILLFLWFCLLANSIFIANNIDSLIRSFGFFRFILLIFAFKYYFEEDKGELKNIILCVWFIIFTVVTIDIFIEFLLGQIF